MDGAVNIGFQINTNKTNETRTGTEMCAKTHTYGGKYGKSLRG